MADPLNPESKPISVGSVIMHPSQRIIACRNASVLGIFDVEKEIKLKEHRSNAKIVFWKWLDEETIGFCTLSNAFTWSLNDNSQPVKMFKLLESLAPHAIVNYEKSDDRIWHAIMTGPRPNVTKEVGIMQLYNAASGYISQQLDGFAACFCKYTFKGQSSPTTLLVHCTKSKTNPHNKGKLCVKDMNSGSIQNIAEEPFIFEFEDDFPTFVQANLTFGVIYLASKKGIVHLFDIESSMRLYSIRFSQIPLFAVTSSENGGIIGINESGQVLSVTINHGTMLKYIGKTKPTLVSMLYTRWSAIPKSPKKPLPRKKPPRVTQRPVVPSAPSLALYDEPPVTAAAPVIPTAPVFPSAPRAPLMIPPSQIHLYAMPPPYSPRDETATVSEERDVPPGQIGSECREDPTFKIPSNSAMDNLRKATYSISGFKTGVISIEFYPARKQRKTDFDVTSSGANTTTMSQMSMSIVISILENTESQCISDL
uniref:Uncharacterized protein n=1 Tax=Pristionchus pacificus TaxID=54126 RepID=A0A2A6BB79_PRIPA|eukprot:PDM63133.1 hypothetical protein PRIPAC_50348 [Pristionchus pacificus]